MGRLVKVEKASKGTFSVLVAGRRKRVFRFLVLPVLVCVYVVGWVLYWLGLR